MNPLRRCTPLFLALAALCCLKSTRIAGGAEFALAGGSHAPDRGPVIFDLPAALQGSEPLAVQEIRSGKIWPAQRIGEKQLAFLFAAESLADATAEFRILPQPEAAAIPSPVSRSCIIRDGRLEVGRSGRPPELVYHLATAEPPQGMDPRYRRSGFIHPVTTPQGRVVTDDFPVDHAHQHGLFAAWVKTEFQGRPIDFWNQLGGTGSVEHRRVLRMVSGPVFAEFQVELADIDLSAPGGPKDVLIEEWTVRSFAIESGTLFDFECVQRCAGDIPLTVEKYHYGGMAARGAACWHKDSDFDFLTSEGLTRQSGNHSRPDWVCMHGSVDGSPCSLTVFSHPSNFRAPQPVRLHPSMPYFVFSPPVLGEFQIRPGEPYSSRYRYFAADGAVNAERLKAIWENFSQPVKLEWKP